MRRGFTLIETVVYVALYALLVSGAFSASYAFAESSSHNETEAYLQEEGTFLIGKVDWALEEMTSVQEPVLTGPELDGRQSDGSLISIRQHQTDLWMQVGGSAEQPLTGAHVSVSNLVFMRAAGAEGVSLSFTLSATSSDGRRISADFFTPGPYF